ncbi:MAG: CehA/McbA family metallohydrolase [bacterium]|nr:CehA/McbA family metallohydrolase [bacterium]
MRRMHNLCPRGLAVLLMSACMALSPAWALTWQHANAADTNTIALYHFNETSGTSAYDAAGARTLTHTSTNMTSAAAPGWMATPIGRYLLCSNNNFATYSTYNIAINWTNGLTISFWLRTADQAGRTVMAIDLSHGDGYRNQNIIAWRPGWSNPLRPAIHDTDLFFDTTPGLATKLLDGQWHHIAVTWNPADTTARFYLDNVLIANWPAAGGHDVALLCNLRVGAGLQDPAQCYVGDVDELLVQNSVITDFADGYGSGPTNLVLAVVPATLTFSGDETTATFQIINAGMGTLQWTNTLAPGAAWLSAVPLLGANRAAITVAVDRTGLAYGSYTGRIEFTANGEIPQETMTIYLNYAPPQLAVAPMILDFGGDGTSMPVAVWNTGVGTVTWSAATSAAWLAVAPAAGTAGAAPTTALVTVNRALLLAYAVYTGMVTFIPSCGTTQVVAAIVSTYPTTGNALLRIHATRPGQTSLACVRAIIQKADGTYMTGAEWGPSTWPVADINGIAMDADTIVTVPVGRTSVTIGKGPDYYPATLVFNASVPGNLYTLDFALQPVLDLYQRGWRAGEIHSHYFHGEGQIMRTPQQVWRFSAAGGFDFVSMGQDHYLAGEFNRAAMLAAWTQFDTTECPLWAGNEEPKNYWGHYCAIVYDPWSLRGPPPYYAGLYNIHQQGGVAFPNHPQRFYPGRTWVSGGNTTWFFYASNNHFKEMPLDALVGHLMDGWSGCSDNASSTSILPAYFALLNRGYRIPFMTDSDVCFDKVNNDMRAPGFWMLYYYLGDNTLCRAALADAMRKGRVMATTGPLVLFTIAGAMSGDTLPADGVARTLRIEAAYPFNPWTLTYRNFATNQDCRITEIALYRNGTLLQSWTPNTPSAVVTREITETTAGAYYMVRVLGNDQRWQAGYASPIYFDAAPRPPHPATWQALVQGKLYEAGSGAALTGTIACVRYGQAYWRIATDAQGLFQARVPIDAQLVARDDRGREFSQEIMKYEPAYRFLSYLSDTNFVTDNAYMPQSIQDFADLVSTMRWEFPMGCQLSASFMYTNLVGDGVISNISIITAPPAFPGNTNTEVALFMVDKSQVQGGDTLNFACIYRQPLGAKPSENLVFELGGWNPNMPAAYNPVQYIGGQSGTSGYTDLGNGFYARTGAITVPTWVSNKASTVAGVVACALVRQTVGGRAWYEEMYLKIPVGPTRRQLLVNAVWDGLAGAWADTGVGPYNFYRAYTHFQNRYADYRGMAISFMLNGQPVTLCPTNVTAHCADADDAQFYEQFYYDAQCEPQYRNIPCRDSVRAQPAWPDFSAVALCDITADPVPPIAVAMEPRADQSFARKDLVQLFWHVEDVASGAANATIIVDGEPVAEHTTQNPIQLDLVPGRHLWYVIGWDAAGNCATSSIASLVVENPEPNSLALTLLSVAMGVARGHIRIGK